MGIDLLIRSANLADGRTGVDIAIKDGHIAQMRPGIDSPGDEEIDASGCLVSAPFVDAHFHMDTALTDGLLRPNSSGTLLEGIGIWSELKDRLTYEGIVERAMRYCDWAVARGLLYIRTHVDITDPRLLAVQALLEVKRRVAPYIGLQLVAFPQNGILRTPTSMDNLVRSLSMGVEVVGGIPHFERTMADGAQSVRQLCELAASRGLRVDMHCDESDDPLSRHVETLAAEATRLGLQGRVTGSHLTSMHSMDNYYVSKLIPLMREAGLSVVANPLVNITLQGRHDTYPKRRGMTRVPELIAAGIDVAFGQDDVLDPFYGMGSADMLEVAHMGLHVAHMTGSADVLHAFSAITEVPARILGLEGYGLAVGRRADLVVLDARDPFDALRLRAGRLHVIKDGRVVSRSASQRAELFLPGREARVNFGRPILGSSP